MAASVRRTCAPARRRCPTRHAGPAALSLRAGPLRAQPLQILQHAGRRARLSHVLDRVCHGAYAAAARARAHRRRQGLLHAVGRSPGTSARRACAPRPSWSWSNGPARRRGSAGPIQEPRRLGGVGPGILIRPVAQVAEQVHQHGAPPPRPEAGRGAREERCTRCSPPSRLAASAAACLLPHWHQLFPASPPLDRGCPFFSGPCSDASSQKQRRWDGGRRFRRGRRNGRSGRSGRRWWRRRRGYRWQGGANTRNTAGGRHHCF